MNGELLGEKVAFSISVHHKALNGAFSCHSRTPVRQGTQHRAEPVRKKHLEALQEWRIGHDSLQVLPLGAAATG